MNDNEGITLYYHHHSFYSQKVIMTLYEKRIPFSYKFVDITRGEQYQGWFLKINPRGEVPVIKDGKRYISDSARIINYLEDNYCKGDYVRLIPKKENVEVQRRIIEMRNEIDKLPVGMITMGSFFNSEICSNLRYPFVLAFVRKHLKAGEQRSSDSLRRHAANNPEVEDILIKKANHQDGKHKIIMEKSEYIRVLSQVNKVLDEVEAQLKSNEEKGTEWLCCDQFTLADISLTILLDRLSRLGLGTYFWRNRCMIAKYYQRAQKRESYLKSIPTVMTDVRLMLYHRTPVVFGVITLFSVVVGGFICYRKHCYNLFFSNGKF